MIDNKQSAFTLLELIMIIVILGILSATALPKFFDKNSFAERAFFDDTLNAVRYAQKLAVATGCQVKVTIVSNQYTITRQGTASSPACPGGSTYSLAVPHPSSGESSFSGAETDVSLSSSPSSFIFNSLGALSTSTDVTLTINSSRTITVIAATGFVYAP